MDNLLFNLKFTAKGFGKSAKKCEKDEVAERKKCKAAMDKGNMDGARIYAQNAIRKKNESLNYLKLESRIDAVASRLDTAIKMKSVSQAMGKVVQGMDKVLQTMDPEKIAKVMDKFEKDFEQLDVTVDFMDNAIGTTTALTTPEDQVNDLMSQIRDQSDLSAGAKIGEVRTGSGLPAGQQAAQETDDLSQRLAALKMPPKQ